MNSFIKKYFLYSCLIFVIISCEQPQQKPNVLFISIDDLRTELGAYGNTVIQTPNIDKLVSNGVAFTNHFVQVPTCGASRHSLLTGMRPQTRAHLGNNVIAKEIATQPEKRGQNRSFINSKGRVTIRLELEKLAIQQMASCMDMKNNLRTNGNFRIVGTNLFLTVENGKRAGILSLRMPMVKTVKV